MAVELLAKSNGATIERFFGDVAALSVPVAQESMKAAGELLLEHIKQSISVEGEGTPSAPGSAPHKQSGDYYASWGMQSISGPAEVGVVVGTDAEYGRRLEWGFVGTDSLGRTYNQAPRPHVGPAVEILEPLLASDLLDKLLTYGPAR